MALVITVTRSLSAKERACVMPVARSTAARVWGAPGCGAHKAGEATRTDANSDTFSSDMTAK